ncbi:hypothetical protein QWZ16_24570, partial [Vibrio ostreicida]|nr:hypothetical protein [Vibrio ostreicida]
MIFLGSFVQTAIGFGLAIVAAPLLFLVSPVYVPAPICLVALYISILNALKHRDSVFTYWTPSMPVVSLIFALPPRDE